MESNLLIANGQSDEQVRQVMAVMPEAILVVGGNGLIRICNPRSELVFGYTQQELEGQPLETLLPERFRSSHLYLRKKYSRNPVNRSMGDGRELFALHKNGHEFPVEVALAPVSAGNNGVVVMVTDISYRKHAEEELRLAANVFSNTLDGILILNEHLKIVKVNAAFERIMGFSGASVLNQPVSMLKAARQKTEDFSTIWTQTNQNGRWQGEVWNRHRDGRVIPLWLSVTALYRLDGSLEKYLVTMYDISEQKSSQERIYYLAHYDVLTSLPNRILFMDRFAHALDKSKREQQRFALMFIDLDNFKQINDTYGHSYGDQLLCSVAERLKATVRESDTVARLSGDEFLILMENLSEHRAAATLAQKLLSELAIPIVVGETELFVSASIGIACYPDDGDDSETLLKNGDMAMYKAKEAGRNRVEFYNHSMTEYVQERVALTADLRRALEETELELYFQPVIDLSCGRCVGAEVLLRWQHPKRGFIPPDKFISLAEESNLIVPLGEWVLRQACMQMQQWIQDGVPLQFLAVNVSGKQVLQTDFVERVAAIFAETGCEPQRITLELTESFVMHQSEFAIAQLQALRELGVGIAIDDFGTGYSSLSYLKRLPITRLKLDRSFVSEIPHETNDIEIARAILKLGDAVNLRVIAEGVETAEQHEFLLQEGCAFSQGYLYAKPMPIDAMQTYISTNLCVNPH